MLNGTQFQGMVKIFVQKNSKTGQANKVSAKHEARDCNERLYMLPSFGKDCTGVVVCNLGRDNCIQWEDWRISYFKALRRCFRPSCLTFAGVSRNGCLKYLRVAVGKFTKTQNAMIFRLEWRVYAVTVYRFALNWYNIMLHNFEFFLVGLYSKYRASLYIYL